MEPQMKVLMVVTDIHLHTMEQAVAVVVHQVLAGTVHQAMQVMAALD
jgi:oligoribonuclease (3'-5' exoribonuclease)